MLSAIKLHRLIQRQAPGDPQRGADVYRTYCSSCHGADGRGGSKASSIVDGSYLALVSDQQLRTIVIAGRPELGAPDWRGDVAGRPMSAQEVSDVVAWLSSQRPKFPGQPYPIASMNLGQGGLSMSAENGISRRAALVKLGMFLNGVVGVFLAVPIVRYLLSPVIREKKFGYESWLSLGGLEQFPAGQTRLATYKNPVVNAWDGETGDIACWVRNVDDHTFQVFAINCAHLGCPVRWFPQSSLFMCPVPWRRLLPGWFARLWTSGARIVPVPLQN